MANLWGGTEADSGIGSANSNPADLAALLDKHVQNLQDFVSGTVKGKTTQALGAAGDIGELKDAALKALTGMDFNSPNDKNFPTSKDIEQAIGVYNPDPSAAEQIGSALDPGHVLKALGAEALRGILIPLRKEGLAVTLAHPSTFYGDDGLLRTEISNSGASFKGQGIDNYLKKELSPKYNAKTGKTDIPSANLDQLIDFPELFDHVPEARNIQVQKYPGLWEWNTGGDFNPDTKVIRLNPDAFESKSVPVPGAKYKTETIEGDPNRLETLLHEVMHWAQDKFGYTGGGNPQQFIPEASKDTWEANKRNIQDKYTQIRDEVKDKFNNDKEWYGSDKQVAAVAEDHPELVAKYKSIDNLNSQMRAFESKYQLEYEAIPGEIESRVDASRLRMTQEQADAYPFEQHYADEKKKTFDALTENYKRISSLKAKRGSL